MHISLIEGKSEWLDGISLHDFPDNLPRGFQFLTRRGVLGLRVDGLVGVIKLRSGQTIRIQPKIGSVNFLTMFLRGEGNLPEAERMLQELASYSTGADRSIEALLARTLFNSADEILRRSALGSRKKEIVRASSTRGNIDIIRTLRNLKTRSADPVVSTTKIRTYDIPENRLITAALARASDFLDLNSLARFAPVLNRWQAKYQSSSDVMSDLAVVQAGLSSNRYSGPRSYYNTALIASVAILGFSGIHLAGADDIEGDCVLINTADVFERYLRATIRRRYAKEGIVVTKGGVPETTLYIDGSYRLEPDIVVYHPTGPVALFDAKYKDPTPADHYQMQTYVRHFQLSQGTLLCPSTQATGVTVKEFMTQDKIFIREVYLPLSDLSETEDYLNNILSLPGL